jgi:pSer/pThr/pTyr-binding forkhead associated (FHA) protein
MARRFNQSGVFGMSTSEIEATIAAGITVVRKSRGGRAHLLEQIKGEGAPRMVVLGSEQLVIGRAEEAEVRLWTRRASRQHAVLALKGTDYVIRDNDSHNGVFLNGVRIHSASLRDGDVIQIADCAFVYREC